MAIRWQFIEDNETNAIWWAWRTVRVDETIEQHSTRFTSYGAAVGDAIRNGFKPSEEHWIVVTSYTVTHFRPGEQPVTVPISAGGLAARVVARKLREKKDRSPESARAPDKPVRQ